MVANCLVKFTVSSNGSGTIAWKQIMFEISKTATPTLASYALYNSDTGEQVNGGTVDFNVNNDTASNNACDGSDTSCELVVTIGTDADDDAMEQISGATTYELRATIGGSVDSSTDNVSVTVDRNTTTHTGKDDFVAMENAGTANNKSFVWSDESASTTGDTAAATTTWNDDYLVKNLPLNWSLN